VDVPTIETARLRLRPWSERDVKSYARILRDPEVLRYFGSGPRYRLKRAAARILASLSTVEARRAVRSLQAHWERCGFGEWALEEKATGELIGQGGLVDQATWVAEPCRTELGFLLKRDAWGRGLGTEAAAAALEHAFTQLSLDRVISITLLENRRSRRMIEGLGLSRVGETHWLGSDVVWYAIDRSEWERRRADQSLPAAYS
jgi:ribosomal-protein-alanine N-acetyltransferase